MTVAIQVADEQLWDALCLCWEGALATDDEVVPGGPRVSAPALPEADAERSADALASTLSQLTQEVTYAAIEARAGELMMFHAGALCDQATGATLAFVAPGGTGKTTLARILGRVTGRGYVTDETVGVRPDLSIEPYRKPLSVRRSEPGPKDETSPLSLGLDVPQAAPWLAGIVLLSRDLPAGEPIAVEVVDDLDALVMLAPETSSLSRFERPLHELADLVSAVGGLRIVRYHDAEDLEPLVGSVLAQSRSVTAASLGREVEPAPGGADDDDDAATDLRRGHLLDRVTCHGSSVVMVESGTGHRIVRLSPLGTAIIDRVGAGVTIERLEAFMLERFGPPADGDVRSAVGEAVQALVDENVLKQMV
ncbi:MAG: hypothetical protein ABI336_11665 [Humibacillus sp.]